MRFLAIDVGSTITGYAIGVAGRMPEKSASIRLRKSGQDVEVALGRAAEMMADLFTINPPQAVVVEDFISKLSDGNSNARTLLVLAEMHGLFKGMAKFAGASIYTPHVQSVRTHFLGPGFRKHLHIVKDKKGKSNVKPEIVKRAQMLGYFDREIYDEDRGDSCALYDYASAVLFHSPISNFQMFGGR